MEYKNQIGKELRGFIGGFVHEEVLYDSTNFEY